MSLLVGRKPLTPPKKCKECGKILRKGEGSKTGLCSGCQNKCYGKEKK